MSRTFSLSELIQMGARPLDAQGMSLSQVLQAGGRPIWADPASTAPVAPAVNPLAMQPAPMLAAPAYTPQAASSPQPVNPALMGAAPTGYGGYPMDAGAMIPLGVSAPQPQIPEWRYIGGKALRLVGFDPAGQPIYKDIFETLAEGVSPLEAGVPQNLAVQPQPLPPTIAAPPPVPMDGGWGVASPGAPPPPAPPINVGQTTAFNPQTGQNEIQDVQRSYRTPDPFLYQVNPQDQLTPVGGAMLSSDQMMPRPPVDTHPQAVADRVFEDARQKAEASGDPTPLIQAQVWDVASGVIAQGQSGLHSARYAVVRREDLPMGLLEEQSEMRRQFYADRRNWGQRLPLEAMGVLDLGDGKVLVHAFVRDKLVRDWQSRHRMFEPGQFGEDQAARLDEETRRLKTDPRPTGLVESMHPQAQREFHQRETERMYRPEPVHGWGEALDQDTILARMGMAAQTVGREAYALGNEFMKASGPLSDIYQGIYGVPYGASQSYRDADAWVEAQRAKGRKLALKYPGSGKSGSTMRDTAMWLTENLPGAAIQLAPTLAAGALTGGSGALLVGGIMEGSGAYGEAVEILREKNGGRPLTADQRQKAMLLALPVAVINAALEKTGVDELLKPAGRRVVGRLLVDGLLAEGGTETLQASVNQIVYWAGTGKLPDLLSILGEGVLGGLMGAGVGGLRSIPGIFQRAVASSPTQAARQSPARPGALPPAARPTDAGALPAPPLEPTAPGAPPPSPAVSAPVSSGQSVPSGQESATSPPAAQTPGRTEPAQAIVPSQDAPDSGQPIQVNTGTGYDLKAIEPLLRDGMTQQWIAENLQNAAPGAQVAFTGSSGRVYQIQRGVDDAGRPIIESYRVREPSPPPKSPAAPPVAPTGVTQTDTQRSPVGGTAVKESWQMTYAEFAADLQARRGDAGVFSPARKREIHRQAVVGAMKAGQDVPAAVLSEYPDLAQGVSAVTQESEVDRIAGEPDRLEGVYRNKNGQILVASRHARGVDRTIVNPDGSTLLLGMNVVPKGFTRIQYPPAPAPAPKVSFTKAQLEQAIEAELGPLADDVGYTAADDAAMNNAGRGHSQFTFYQKLPGEVKNFLEGRFHLRKLFKVTQNASEAGGEDAMSDLGDDYWRLAEKMGNDRTRLLVEAARRSGNPRLELLAKIHENLAPKKLGTRVKGEFTQTGRQKVKFRDNPEYRDKEIIDPETLPEGSTFQIEQSTFEITQADDGDYLVMKDGAEYPVVPVEMAGPIPVDKGTVEKPASDLDEGDLPDVDLEDFAPPPDSPDPAMAAHRTDAAQVGGGQRYAGVEPPPPGPRLPTRAAPSPQSPRPVLTPRPTDLPEGYARAGGKTGLLGQPVFDAPVGETEMFGFGDVDQAAKRERAKTYSPEIERKGVEPRPPDDLPPFDPNATEKMFEEEAEAGDDDIAAMPLNAPTAGESAGSAAPVASSVNQAVEQVQQEHPDIPIEVVPTAQDVPRPPRSRRQRAGGMGIQAVEKAISALRKRFPKAPFIVIETEDDLADLRERGLISGDILAYIAKRNLRGKVQGFLDQNTGVIVLIGENLPNARRARRVAWHELVGHAGVDAALTAREKGFIVATTEANDPELVASVKARYEEKRWVSEIVAALSERYAGQPRPAWYRRILARIRFAISRAVGEPYDDADIEYLIGVRAADAARKHIAKNGGIALSIAAWTGSPHDYDKASTDFIGTGEGAQAYGWGLYFSSLRKVAEWYRDKLSDAPVVLVGGQAMSEQVYSPWGGEESLNGSVVALLARIAMDSRSLGQNTTTGEIVRKAKEEYENRIAKAENRKDLDSARIIRDHKTALERMESKGITIQYHGKLYEVELAPNEDELLDWDKALADQSEKVYHAIRQIQTTFHSETWEAAAGGALYEILSSEFGSQEAASKALKKRGIRGIKYLDQSSRSAGEGSYNYVIFDDADVEIKAKFSLAEEAVPHDQDADVVDARADGEARTPTAQDNSPQRQALRAEKAREYQQEHRATRQDRIAVLVIGPPGAGKSSVIADTLVKRLGAMLLDSDLIKRKLPEFDQRGGAFVTHEESGLILSDLIVNQAVARGDNLVWSMLGRNESGLRRVIQRLQNEGYQIRLAGVFVPPQVAAQRSVTRWRKGTQGFVDPAWIVNVVGNSPEKVYDALKNDPTIEASIAFDNNVPEGSRPRILHQRGDLHAQERVDVNRPGHGSQSGAASVQSPRSPSQGQSSQEVEPPEGGGAALSLSEGSNPKYAIRDGKIYLIAENLTGPEDARAAAYEAIDALQAREAPEGDSDELGRIPGPLGAVVAPASTPPVPVDPLPGGKIEQLKDIILELGRNVGKTVRVSPQGPNLGSYTPSSTRASIRYAGDLLTTAHEVAGHLLDDRHGVLAAWKNSKNPSPYDAELIPDFIPPGYVGRNLSKWRQRAEAFAGWMEAYLVNPAEAMRRAPQTYQHMISVLPAAELTAIREFGDKIRQFAGLKPFERAQANMQLSDPKRSMLDRIKSWIKPQGKGRFGTLDLFTRMMTSVESDSVPFEKAIEEGMRRSGKKPLPQHDPRILAGAYLQLPLKVAEFLDSGIVDRDGKQLTPGGLKWMLEPLDSSTGKALDDDLRAMLTMMAQERALEIAKRIDDEAEAKIDKLAEAAGLQPGWTIVDAYRVDPKLARRIRWLRRAVQIRLGRELTGQGGGLYADHIQAGEALKQVWDDDTRYQRLLEGAKRYRQWANALLTYGVQSHRWSQDAVNQMRQKNQFYVAWHRVIDELDEPVMMGRGMGRKTDPIKRIKGSARQMENPLLSLMTQTSRIIGESDRNYVLHEFNEVLTSQRKMYDGKPVDLDDIGSRSLHGPTRDSIPVWHDGKMQHWQYEAGVRAFFMQLAKGDVEDDLVAAMARLPGWWLRMGVTLSPAYMVRNIIKDTTARPLLSEHGGTPFDILKGSNVATRREMRLTGGMQFGKHIADKEGWRREMRLRLGELVDDPNTILLTGDKYLKLIGMSENFGREAEYRRAKRHALDTLGYNEQNARLYASYHARELLAFNRQGRFLRAINQKVYIPFLGAAVQGPFRTLRAVRHHPGRFAFIFAQYVLLPRLLAYAWAIASGDDEEYEQLPSWRRDFFINIKIGDMWLSIPQPFEIAVMGAGVERALSALRGQPNAIEGFGRSVASSVVPVDEAVLSGPFRGLVETMTNYSFFFDRFIVPPWEENKNLELRDTSRASRLGQAGQRLTQLLGGGVDARKIDNLVRNMFGNVGGLAMDLSDLGREDRPPGRFWGQTGIVRPSVASSSRDAQWVMAKARELGLEQSKMLDPLDVLIKEHQRAGTMAERDEAAKKVRQEATRLRKYLEANENVLLEQAKEKFRQRIEGRKEREAKQSQGVRREELISELREQGPLSRAEIQQTPQWRELEEMGVVSTSEARNRLYFAVQHSEMETAMKQMNDMEEAAKLLMRTPREEWGEAETILRRRLAGPNVNPQTRARVLLRLRTMEKAGVN